MRKNEASQMATQAESMGWSFVTFEVRERRRIARFRRYQYSIVVKDPQSGRRVRITNPKEITQLNLVPQQFCTEREDYREPICAHLL